MKVVLACSWNLRESVVIVGWPFSIYFCAVLKWCSKLGQVLSAVGLSCQLRMSLENTDGRVMMMSPMLMSWAVVSGDSAASAISAYLVMAVNMLAMGLVCW